MVDLAGQAKLLADGVLDAVPRWVERSVDRIYRAWAGPPPASVSDAARLAASEAAAAIGPELRALLEADVDAQQTTPLSVVRKAVPFPTAVLADAGVPPVRRDAVDEVMFPGDPYGLTPATLGDLGPALGDLAIAWGAAKAWTHKQRHG